MKKRLFSLILASLLLLSLVSCSSYNASSSDKKIEYDSEYGYSYEESIRDSGSGFDGAVSEDAIVEPEAPMESAPDMPQTNGSASSAPDVTAGRKIIYTSDFNIETKEFDNSIATLDAICTEFGAWYENSNSYGTADRGNRNAYFTIRVPVENYKAFISRQGTVGVIISSSENNRDVTEIYTDIEARLASATLREERVLVILENADLLDDVLALERELADIRYEIESLTGSLRKYDSQINYSTVSISIREVTTVTPKPPKTLTFSERLSKSFDSGIENFKNGVQSLILNISYNLIGFIFWLIVIIVLVVFVIIKIRRYKKKKTQKEEKTSVPEKNESQEKDLNKEE